MAPPAIAYTLPAMQLVCNIVIPEVNPILNNTNPTGSNNNQTIPQIPSVNIPSDYIAHPDIGVAYRVYNESVSWKTARESCISQNARLAVIDTYIKFEYLINQTSKNNAIHVGVRSMYDGVEWVGDTTGSTIPTPPWAAGYPNGAPSCVVAGYSPRGLRNVACTSKINFACEVPVH